MSKEDPLLYQDIKAAAQTGALAVPDSTPTQDVDAIERGHREYPDGKTEDYERIEFKDR